jgi:serine/threonine-protein kinase HipA
MSERCLVCFGETEKGEEYHPRCSLKFFGTSTPPALDISLKDLREYAALSVLERITVTGVQKKLSLSVEKRGKEARFTIVGLWGKFILKPPVDEYPFLPENEDTVMHLAGLAGIPTVPHAMIRLASGELGYITRRVDRDESGKKIGLEDFCQISGRLTEDKYKGSVERIGKLLLLNSVYPGLDAVDLFERVVFCYLCGNADMHLKNYSLIETLQGMRLAPAYDLVSTALPIPDDPEESALTINGKKSRLVKTDFDALAASLEIRKPAVRKAYGKMLGLMEPMITMAAKGRLPEESREKFCGILQNRLKTFA